MLAQPGQQPLEVTFALPRSPVRNVFASWASILGRGPAAEAPEQLGREERLTFVAVDK